MLGKEPSLAVGGGQGCLLTGTLLGNHPGPDFTRGSVQAADFF